ncbi:MAG: G8 domain-containing protein, partial [Bacteroidota bacterium]
MQLSIHTLKTIMIYALMICPFVLMCQGSNWSDPSTWPDDRVPRVRDNVEIPAGRTIYLDISPPELGAINIRGELIFAETDLELTAKTIVINGGLLQIGTEDAPFEHRATITLNGPDEDLLGMGARHLAVMSGGRLDLHGASANKRPWTQISGSLASGSSELVLAEQPDNWAVGDEFVLAPSGYDPYEAERLTIEEINGNRIRFSPALAYEHYGEIQNYTLGDGTIQELDERAEVGMLTRNIIIQGAEDSQDLRLGGHIMIMQGSGPIQVEGIGLRRMGQPGRAGRYSFHWHLCGDRTGDYVRNCSVYDGLQRGIVVHGTDNVRVENNVGYNIQNHIFIPAEDGNEVGNYFINNLAVLARRVDEGFFAFPNSGKPDRVSDQAEHRPSGFWMRNLHNILIGNHVAGAERGVGFFFDRRARHRDFRYFDALDQPLIYQDNVAHSISVTTVNNNAGSNVAMYARVGHGFGIFIDDFQNEDVELIFEDFVFYKCDMSGVWNESDNVLIRNSVFADNTSAFISGSARVEDALVVGRSANQLGENRVLRHGHDRTGFYTIAQGGKKKPQMRNVSFFNMHEDTDSEAAAFILDFKLEVKPNYVEDIYVEDSRPLWMETRGAPGRSPDGANLYDMDGSLTGYNEPVTVIWPTSPLLRDDCDFVEEWNAYICPPDQFIDVQFDFDPSDVNRIDIDIEQE